MITQKYLYNYNYILHSVLNINKISAKERRCMYLVHNKLNTSIFFYPTFVYI